MAGAPFSATELLQSEGNRVTQAVMRANLQSLRLLADKLYRRNPAEWRKTAATREEALARLDGVLQSGQDWPPLAGRREFYYLDGIDPQHVYNAARNMEIALWILNTRRDARGVPLLHANELTADARNLSFEREFGKIIARLDLLASYMTERYRRAVIDYAQGLLAAPLLAFLPVR